MGIRFSTIFLMLFFVWQVDANQKELSSVDFSDVLNDYIKIKDVPSDCKYLREGNEDKNGVKTKTYIFQSQKWPVKHYDDFSQSIWKHRLVIYFPKEVLHNKVLLYVNGGYINKGANNENPKENADLSSIAADNGVIVIELRDVPNQFLIVDGEAKKGDQIIAYSFKKFMENPEQNLYIPAHLPMTKAIVRAIDVIQKLLLDEYGIKIDGFVLSGASKLRGWPVWLALLIEPRIEAIIPINIDILSFKESILHVCQFYKFGCPHALDEYVKSGIIEQVHSKEFDKLMQIVAPLKYLDLGYDAIYRERLSKPKYIINSSGDDFFAPDTSQLYYSLLPGENHIRYIANTTHFFSGNSLSKALKSQLKVRAAMSNYLYFHLNSIKLPKVAWKFSHNKVRINSSMTPKLVNVWHVVNPDEKDFRCVTDVDVLSKISRLVKSLFSNHICDHTYQAKKFVFSCENSDGCVIDIDLPKFVKGWRAAFISLHYSINGRSFRTSTQVNIDKAQEK
jgi:PhoPQ-activated pathogenicity-related protein